MKYDKMIAVNKAESEQKIKRRFGQSMIWVPEGCRFL